MPALQRDQRIGVDAKQPPRRAVALTVFERLRLRLVSYEVAEHGVLEAIHEVHEFVIAQNFKHPSLGVVVIDGMKALLSLHVYRSCDLAFCDFSRDPLTFAYAE